MTINLSKHLLSRKNVEDILYSKEAHGLSTTNGKLSDQKVFEAEEMMKQLEKMTCHLTA